MRLFPVPFTIPDVHQEKMFSLLRGHSLILLFLLSVNAFLQLEDADFMTSVIFFSLFPLAFIFGILFKKIWNHEKNATSYCFNLNLIFCLLCALAIFIHPWCQKQYTAGLCGLILLLFFLAGIYPGWFNNHETEEQQTGTFRSLSIGILSGVICFYLHFSVYAALAGIFIFLVFLIFLNPNPKHIASQQISALLSLIAIGIVVWQNQPPPEYKLKKKPIVSEIRGERILFCKHGYILDSYRTDIKIPASNIIAVAAILANADSSDNCKIICDGNSPENIQLAEYMKLLGVKDMSITTYIPHPWFLPQKEYFDLILLNLMLPDNFAHAKFFKTDFYQKILRQVKTNGVLAIRVPQTGDTQEDTLIRHTILKELPQNAATVYGVSDCFLVVRKNKQTFNADVSFIIERMKQRGTIIPEEPATTVFPLLQRHNDEGYAAKKWLVPAGRLLPTFLPVSVNPRFIIIFVFFLLGVYWLIRARNRQTKTHLIAFRSAESGIFAGCLFAFSIIRMMLSGADTLQPIECFSIIVATALLAWNIRDMRPLTCAVVYGLPALIFCIGIGISPFLLFFPFYVYLEQNTREKQQEDTALHYIPLLSGFILGILLISFSCIVSPMLPYVFLILSGIWSIYLFLRKKYFSDSAGQEKI